MKFDPHEHNRRSIRLPEYDYSQPGAYFVTIVAWHREYLFGEVVNGEIILNKYGLVAKQQWEKLPKRFPNIELGAFVVMPNHVHIIIRIIEVSRRHEAFQKPVKGSIPTVIRSYKSAVSYRINLMRGTQDIPVWQRNYYEHIIRNEKDLKNITDYIHANPLLWEQDNENPSNITFKG
jgi:putative transposase